MMDSTSLERLTDEQNIWLATVRPDRTPHLTPVWFVFVDEAIWIGTGVEAVKVRNVRANPAVSLSLQDGDAPIVLEGVVTLHDSERPDPVARAFLAKYGWDITVPVDPDVGQVILWEVRVDRWLLG